eukprot:CAMPEP_0184858318 /NCGR_PEP_ID=MMETSP0580-20130426/3434_1 /TAXON_ID=1118495 /ORGANISM="Dactyliosolen fragilissimus" /LENGTH=667 /DNA_ID=CAMNT_0027354407 /DNA_START=202 /DNA_END=2205 /DNA_ORIENTATION=+
MIKKNDYPKSSYLLDTDTTETQRDTERECEPFYQDLTSLPTSQIAHLRQVGLLPPHSPTNTQTKSTTSSATTNNNTSTNANTDQNNTPPSSYDIRLLRKRHIDYLTRPLHHGDIQPLPRGYTSLDSSRPWILYWCLHGLDLLDGLPTNQETLLGIVHTLEACWMDYDDDDDDDDDYCCPNDDHGDDDDGENGNKGPRRGGGFGGGPGQIPHCATTYAAVLALSIVAASSGKRSKSRKFDYSRKQNDDDPNDTDDDNTNTDSKIPCASDAALNLLERKRKSLYRWFLSLKVPLGDVHSRGPGGATTTTTYGYRMHHDGEVDVRAAYTVLCVCSLLNILDSNITSGVLPYLANCQTYEGGFGGDETNEAHGGYTFCALAAFRILTASDTTTTITNGMKHNHDHHQQQQQKQHCNNMKYHGLDLWALKGWLTRRQMSFEGGFSGRSNKLVDGCYSFWQGGSCAILDIIMQDVMNHEATDQCLKEEENPNLVRQDQKEELDQSQEQRHHLPRCALFDSGIYASSSSASSLDPFGIWRHVSPNTTTTDLLTYDRQMLQRYILFCAQNVNGGLRDKPSKDVDFYHSCYNLSGLSISQHCLTITSDITFCSGTDDSKNHHREEDDVEDYNDKKKCHNHSIIYGDTTVNSIGATHPVFNILVENVHFILKSFYKK